MLTLRRSLAAGCCLAGLIALPGCGSSAPAASKVAAAAPSVGAAGATAPARTTPTTPSRTTTAGGPTGARIAGGAVGAGAAASSAAGSSTKGTAHLVADPQEARSFPAPASARHASAATPAHASEAAVAAGAQSDAEVRAELAQEASLERASNSSAVQRGTPVPGGNSVGGNGSIPIPAGLPEVVQRVIAGANEIADFPYVFGGGHGSFVDSAYDCSGSVSYALAAGGLLAQPEASGELESWGAAGPGRYITVYANAGHAYMYVDGVLYDTAGRSGVYASRWQIGAVDNSGFVARHWPGL